MEKSPTRKGPTTPDRQAARPLVLDCALYERECNRPHVRSNAFTSPASPHPHGITSSAIGSPCSCCQGGHVCITDDSPWFQSNPPPSHHAVKATRVRVHSKVVLSPPDLTPRPADARRYRRKTVVRQGGQPGLDAEAPTDPLAVELARRVLHLTNPQGWMYR